MTHQTGRSGSRALALGLLAAAALAACGGGSANRTSAPAIGAVPDQFVLQAATVGPIALPITAGGSQAASLAVTATVADPTLVPPRSVVLGGTGTDRTLTLVPDPDQSGTTAITVTVSDAMGHVATRVFSLTVTPVYEQFTPYATTTFGTDENATPMTVSGRTFVPDADGNANAFSTLLQ
jgi:hypothetical protein